MKKLLSLMGSFNMFVTTAIATSFVVSCGVNITIPPQPRNLQDCIDYINSIESLRYELKSKRNLAERDINKQLENNKISSEESLEMKKNNKAIQNSIKIEHNIYAMNIQKQYYSNDETWLDSYNSYVQTVSKHEYQYSSPSTIEHISQLIEWLNEGLPIEENTAF